MTSFSTSKLKEAQPFHIKENPAQREPFATLEFMDYKEPETPPKTPPTASGGSIVDKTHELSEPPIAQPSAQPAIGQGKWSIGSWIKKEFQAVKKAVGIYRDSDLSHKEMFQFFYSFGIRNGALCKEFATDYLAFKKSKKPGATLHPLNPTEKEKRAFDLYKRSDTLTKREKDEFQALLQELHQEETAKRQAIFLSAEGIVKDLTKAGEIRRVNLEDRKAVEQIVKETYLRESSKQLDDLSLDDFVVIELATSKILLVGIDRKLGLQGAKKQQISYLIAVAKEHNRIKKKSEYFTGEDFLRVKVEQLNFLFKGIQNLDWTLSFVDDKPFGASNTSELIKQKIAADPELNCVKDKIFLLDY